MPISTDSEANLNATRLHSKISELKKSGYTKVAQLNSPHSRQYTVSPPHAAHSDILGEANLYDITWTLPN